MEPLSIMAMTAVGLGMQVFGAAGKSEAGNKYNAAQIRQIQLEQQVEAQRRKTMELEARRMSMENLRNVQRAQAVARTAAVSSGGGLTTSSYAGGQAQASAQGSWNESGIAGKLEIGRNIFDINQMISGTKVDMANAQKSIQDYQGWSSLGQSLTASAPTFGRIASGFDNKSNKQDNTWGFG